MKGGNIYNVGDLIILIIQNIQLLRYILYIQTSDHKKVPFFGFLKKENKNLEKSFFWLIVFRKIWPISWSPTVIQRGKPVRKVAALTQTFLPGDLFL